MIFLVVLRCVTAAEWWGDAEYQGQNCFNLSSNMLFACRNTISALHAERQNTEIRAIETRVSISVFLYVKLILYFPTSISFFQPMHSMSRGMWQAEDWPTQLQSSTSQTQSKSGIDKYRVCMYDWDST